MPDNWNWGLPPYSREQPPELELAALKKEQEEKLEGLSKRLEEVERQRLSLQQEVTTKSNELSATAKRWLGELSALDRGLAAAFPEAQEEALAAVGRAREDRRQATGEQSSDCFTMDDYLASIAARVEPVTKLGWELRKAAEELVRLLWPTETLPEDLSNLIAWLDRAPDRFLDWKESATRAGADMAEDEEADDVPADDPAAGSADAPPAGPGSAGA
ncbi:uncharacterized protein [Lolium perenne]|uniref:uncharacterized protein n=1 Tax=Lolium perenne TaxID=4522 RepID=UPI003A99C890